MTANSKKTGLAAAEGGARGQEAEQGLLVDRAAA